MRTPALAWLVGLVALLTAATPASAGPVIGISDQNAAAFSHPLFGWAGIRHARVIAQWDAAMQPSPGLEQWLAAAGERGLEPHVTFGNRRGEDCRATRCVLPSPTQMRAAVQAFRARWPHVRSFSTWNEANHPGQPSADRPADTARLYEALAAECAGCRVVAVEVIDLDSSNGRYGLERWLRDFRGALSSDPRLWGLHNYGDVTRDRQPGVTDRMLAMVPGEVWLTETGGIVSHVGRWPYDEARARASVERALAIADRHAGRITRMYPYQWQAAPWESWDSGLMRPDGTHRPSFDVLAARWRPGVPVPSVPADPASPFTAGDGGSAVPGREVIRTPDGTIVVATASGRAVFVDTAGRRVLMVLARPRYRRGEVRARVACPAEHRGSCAVGMRVLAGRAPARGGRRLGGTARRLPAGQRAALIVRLRPADRRRVRRGVLRRLTAVVSVRGGPAWRTGLRARR